MKSKSKVEQKNNVAYGDIVGGDKITQVMEAEAIAKASTPLRQDTEFNLEIDGDNTTLLKKLSDGKLNSDFKTGAVQSKLNAMRVILTMGGSRTGKKYLADIYANLLSVIRTKYIVTMDDEDLLKVSLPQIREEFVPLAKKYADVFEIDEAFIEGLLYIATSNCALKWKIGEAS